MPIAAARDSGWVVADSELRARLSRELVPEPLRITAATCHNAVRWARDISLDLAILVGTAPVPIRIAELVTDEVISVDVGNAALEAWLNGRPIADALPNGDDVELVALIEESPSDAAGRRFVAYATSLTTRTQELVVLDTRRLVGKWDDASEVFGPLLLVDVAGAIDQRVDITTCERFYPTLPSDE